MFHFKKRNAVFITFLLLIIGLIAVISYSKTDDAKKYSFKIVNTYPHDADAFTQGLVFNGGYLYESTGLYGKSSIRKVDINTGEVLKKKKIPKKFFGEGITIYKNKFYMVTWRSKTGFIYNKDTFEYLGSFNYKTQGWGITHDEKNLILSDGTANLYFINPQNFEVIKTLQVKTKSGNIVKFLNELEYVNGKIYSNIWQTDKIAIIDPKTGTIQNMIDFSELKQKIQSDKKIDVFNGIAYNPDSKTFYLTGKLWPKLFEVKLIESK